MRPSVAAGPRHRNPASPAPRPSGAGVGRLHHDAPVGCGALAHRPPLSPAHGSGGTTVSPPPTNPHSALTRARADEGRRYGSSSRPVRSAGPRADEEPPPSREWVRPRSDPAGPRSSNAPVPSTPAWRRLPSHAAGASLLALIRGVIENYGRHETEPCFVDSLCCFVCGGGVRVGVAPEGDRRPGRVEEAFRHHVLVQMKAEAVLHASRGVDAGIIAETVERTERIVQDGLREGVEGSAVAGVECPPGLQSGCCGVFGVFRAVGGSDRGGVGSCRCRDAVRGLGGGSFSGSSRGSGPVAGVAGSCGLVVRAVGGRVAGWRGERPGLGVDAVTVEGRAGIGRLRAGLREARVGDGFLEGAVVFFARGSGWAWDAAASAAEEATASSGPCAGGWRYPGPAAAPGGAVPGPRRPGGGRTRRPSSLSCSSTGLNGPTAAAGSARGRPEAASRPLARRGPRSWRRVRLPVDPPGTGQDGSCRRRIFRAGPAGWPGRRRHRARDETGGRHHVYSSLAGIRLWSS